MLWEAIRSVTAPPPRGDDEADVRDSMLCEWNDMMVKRHHVKEISPRLMVDKIEGCACGRRCFYEIEGCLPRELGLFKGMVFCLFVGEVFLEILLDQKNQRMRNEKQGNGADERKRPRENRP